MHPELAAALKKAKSTEPEPSAVADTWPAIAPDAYHGLAGHVVRSIEPHTESDPVAILVQYLVQFGNAVGRKPYYQVEGDKHFTNLFGVLVGQSSKSRKGTSAGRVRQVIECADLDWANKRIHGGLSSGEGLIWNVRDPITHWEKNSKGIDAPRIEQEIDPGVSDKRLMIIEPEFAGALTAMQRQGNTLSRVIRNAWDRGDLASLTKNSPAHATGAHISIVGHITEDELRHSLDRVSMANGFANRFLYVSVRRGRVLPHGGNFNAAAINELGKRTGMAIEHARGIDLVRMNSEARTDWERIYAALSDARPGILGAIVGRGEAQTIRLALIYALLDGKTEIGTQHLRAAVALWEYCESSARHIFGDLLGNPVADKILRALRHAGETGITRTQIRDLFERHCPSTQIDTVLAELLAAGKATTTRIDTGGRPSDVWVAAGGRVSWGAISKFWMGGQPPKAGRRGRPATKATLATKAGVAKDFGRFCRLCRRQISPLSTSGPRPMFGLLLRRKAQPSSSTTVVRLALGLRRWRGSIQAARRATCQRNVGCASLTTAAAFSMAAGLCARQLSTGGRSICSAAIGNGHLPGSIT